MASGDLQSIVDDAVEHGVEATVLERSSEELAVLEAAARYQKRPDIARRALLAQRSDSRVSSREGSGVLAGPDGGERGRPGCARGWYERYYRKIRTEHSRPRRWGATMIVSNRIFGAERARPLAETYMKRWPTVLTRNSPARSRRSMKGAVAFAVLLMLGIATATARGEEPPRPLVALLRARPPHPALGQMFVRLEGELRAAGFDVTIRCEGAGRDSQAAIARASEAQAPAAIIGVFGGSLGGMEAGMEMWVADRRTGRSVVRRLNASGETGTRASEILAIRAAEQLSASLIDLDLAPKPAAVVKACRGPPTVTKVGRHSAASGPPNGHPDSVRSSALGPCLASRAPARR